MSGLIKQRAQCCKFLMSNGDIVHYVRVGGLWYYNGRKSLVLSKEAATSDGFWLDHLKHMIANRFSYTFEDMVNTTIAKNNMKNPKLVRYISEWIPTGDRA